MTLTDVLLRAASGAPEQGVVHVDGSGGERFTSYAGLWAQGLRVAGGLRAAGLGHGDPLLVVAEDSTVFLPLFWGAVLSGAVPVPLPPEPHRVAAVRRLLGDPPLAGDDAGRLPAVAQLLAADPLPEPFPARPDDLALLQFSSGSTGAPKGVELTHANVVANLEQARLASQADASDVMVTWMPYFHDMGLIGNHLAPVHLRCRQVRLSPLTFAKRPEAWLRTAARHRATILSAANFALALTTRRVSDEVLDELDLSSVRLLMVGAEPISPAVWRAFAAKLRRARLDPHALQPVYGLAEATVAVSSPPMGELARPVRLSRAALARGVAVDVDPGAEAAEVEVTELMDVGFPVPGCTIRIVDDSGRPVEAGLVGHVQVSGANVTRGYHRDPAATAAVLVDGWLRTGDVGFLRGGRLCVTGREKDVLFVHGRTFHAADLEEVAAATPGLGTGPIAVVGATDPADGRERIVVFVAAPVVANSPGAAERIRRRVAEALAYDDVRVRVVPRGAFARTTSGKLRRQALRDRIGFGGRKPADPTTAPPVGEPPTTRAKTEETVRAVWARVLRIPAETIGPDDRFLEIGGSSLAAMEVLAALEEAFDRNLEPAALRDCATFPALADRLLGGAEPVAARAGARPPTAGADLAVIGMACRFPHADTPEAFWDNLITGRDSVTAATRWPGGHGAFLPDPALFDAAFFGIDDAEARYLDPHARIFLELAHEALERAGYAGPRRHAHRIGVFAAVGESGYPELLADADLATPHALTGNLRNLTAARVAHLLDLHGPALAIDTACSSALVALHLARLSLAAGDCDVALVGAVNLNLTTTGQRLLAGAQTLSATGRCRAFAADADGFVPGEGGGVLVLTRLGATADPVLAVVRGTAINNDGRSLSLMAPNPLRQREVIIEAYREVDPGGVTYVEAHGTGTPVGDPIEARSLAHAFPPLPGGAPRLLGSVKTNVGHLLNAAAMPALLKVVLAFQHRELPPSLHHDAPSPRFDLAGAGFEVLTERRAWSGPLAAINSFGFGGTNAHAVLAAPPALGEQSRMVVTGGPPQGAATGGAPRRASGGEVPQGAAAGPHLLTLSARSAAALRRAAADLAAHLYARPHLREADVCASVSTARDDGPYRIALVADGDLAAQLLSVTPGAPVGRVPRVAFLFGEPGIPLPGQGAALYATAPEFRAVLDDVSEDAGPIAGRTLVAWCTDPSVPASELARDEVARPVSVAFAVAQDAQLRAYGLRPDAVAGESLAASAATGARTATEAVLDAMSGGRTASPAARACAGPERDARLRPADCDAVVEVGAPGDARKLLATAGSLWQRGAPLDRTRLDAGTRRVALPTYPFQRRRYWVTDPAPVLSVLTWADAPATGTPATGPVTVLRGDPGPATAPVAGHLLVVTEDVFATGIGMEIPDPAQAVRLGLAMAWADENPGLGVRVVDLSSADSEEARRAAVEGESRTPPVPGPAEVVAWRGGRRLERVPGPAPAAGPVDLPADGSYLIVGGAGAAGSAIARDLARRGRPSLLLAGRSGAPDDLLRELRDLGATVDYRVADVAVEADVAALVAGRSFDVVVQAAGTVRPGSLRSKTAAGIAAGIAAKVRGTELLARAVAASRPLVVALSSVSSVLPGLAGALGDYVAGNAYLDAFAGAERAAGRRFVAVNLPALAGGGLTGGAIAGELQVGQVPEVLWSAAGLGAAQVLVGVQQPPGRPGAVPLGKTASTAARPVLTIPASAAAEGAAGAAEGAAEAAEGAAEAAEGAAEAAEGAAEAAEGDLVGLVRELLAGPLDREPETIGLDQPFLSLGLDSLTAVDLVKELETRLGRTLSTTLFFEHGTVGELARHLGGAPEFPLSPVQQAFETTGRLYPGVPAYAYVRQTVTGPTDPDRLGRALSALEARHPMLRVRFGPGGQRFAEPGTGRLAASQVGAGRPGVGGPAWFTVTALSGPVEALDAELRNRPFDLTREAPVRAVLAVESPDLAHLILVAHHAAADGYSLALLGDELWALHSGAEPPAAPQATFADHEALRTAPAAADLEHWRGALAGYPELPLPFDGTAEPQPPYAVHQVTAAAELTGLLTRRARAAGVSLFHLLLAGYVRCLARWSGQSAVPVTVARAGRTARLPGVERMIGPFADTLPVLARVDPGEPASALAARLRDAWLDSERHGSVSSLDVARMLATSATGPRTASPASFSFARFPGAGATAGHVTAITAGAASAATRLGLVCFEAHGALHFSWNYPAALLGEATVRRFAAEHLAEITALAGGPPAIAPPATAPRAGGPGQGGQYERGQSLADRIRAQCHRTPAAAAVLTDGSPLSYLDLDLVSDRLAARLAATGARHVGLLTGPGADTVIGVLGILKAGAAWVPLDVAHPPARLREQLTRTGATLVVCDATTRTAARALDDRTLVDTRSAPPGTPPTVATGPDDTAYIMFTSGSTGRPKGVPITHRALANYLDWAVETFGYHAGDRLAQTASICFDASVRQILAPLLVGATVVAWDRDTVRDPGELLRRVVQDRITVWSSVPTLWERLLGAVERSAPDLAALRWVHVGGEELSAAHVRRWFDLAGPGQRITNLYGPTETTINVTCHIITERPADDVLHLPIGRPVRGALAEVLDSDGNRCGPGEVGELHIGGVGVADGYLDDPGLTAAAFVEHDGRRWYRSGDRAVRDADGVFWFRGRLDDQVKLHGHRIEPGEVEAVLRRHPAVDRSAVRVDGGRLVARVQPRGDTAPTGAQLRSYLSGLLPSYLIPARIEVLAELPLTATGKVDRSVPAPASRTERLLAEVWSRQLGVARVGRDDDYFALGGDSIGVLDMFAMLEADLPNLPRPTVIYRSPTLAQLAAAIDETPARPTPEGAAPEGDEFPLTPSQRGFLLADAVGAPSTWLAAPRLHGPLDRERFQHAVDALVARHPMLRTVFRPGARPPTQRELSCTPRLVVEYEPEPGPLAAELAAERAHRFDPARWPLVRLRLLRAGPEEHVLLMHAHHLVGDGYSVALLARDLFAAYDGRELPPLRSTFRDYVALLDGLTPTVVTNDTSGRSAATATAGFTLAAPAVTALRALGTPPFVPVLTAYHRCLAKVTGGTDQQVGVAVTGRDLALPDLPRVFGPCATAISVRPGTPVAVPSGAPGVFGDDLVRTAGAVADARTRSFLAPRGWRYFFTYLDFTALGRLRGDTLRLTWDDTDAELTVPPGTEVLLAVRPVEGGGLRLTLRGRIAPQTLDRITADLRSELEHAARPHRVPPRRAGRLEAALIGYLPAPGQLRAVIPAAVRDALPALGREAIRASLSPDGAPRLLETVETPLGRSGFVCLPRFADELGAPGLARDGAAAADLAAAHGARTVSLAGLIPAYTGYGTAMTPLVRSSALITTGHAVTAASVVRTALAAVKRPLSDCVVAILGVGSIGSASLRLLLARGPQPPAGLILCDLPPAAGRLAALAESLDYAGPVEIAVDGPGAVYRADVILGATSGGPGTLDVDRLRPGTVVVDDSFPHCFDPAHALTRMRDRHDVLVVGGGLLHCGPLTREVTAGLPSGQFGLPGAIASCQLESLLHAATPGLPLITGPVDAARAGVYWDALDAAGVGAAPLHLLTTLVGPLTGG